MSFICQFEKKMFGSFFLFFDPIYFKINTWGLNKREVDRKQYAISRIDQL